MPIDSDILNEFFLDYVDVYRRAETEFNVATGLDEEVGHELVVANQRVMMDPKGEASSASPIGRMNRDNMLTTDIFYFPDDGPPVEDGYMLRLVTPGHPENGTWFSVQGGRQVWKMFGASGVPAIRSLAPGMVEP